MNIDQTAAGEQPALPDLGSTSTVGEVKAERDPAAFQRIDGQEERFAADEQVVELDLDEVDGEALPSSRFGSFETAWRSNRNGPSFEASGWITGRKGGQSGGVSLEVRVASGGPGIWIWTVRAKQDLAETDSVLESGVASTPNEARAQCERAAIRWILGSP